MANNKMNKIEITQKKGQKTLIAILVIGVAVYLGFTPLFKLIGGGVAGAVVGSSFGAIFVIVLTMYLLNKQTEIEQESKKSERVFDEKVQLYKEILSTTRNMIEDGEITSKEVTKLPFALMNLQMLGGDEAIDTYEKVFSKINEIYTDHEEEEVSIDEEEKLEIYGEMSRFAVQCRVDLGISDRKVNEELFARTIQTIEKSSKALEVKGGSANASYVEEGSFYDTLIDRGIEANIVEITKRIHERLKKEFNDERYSLDFVVTSTTSTPKLSIKVDGKRFSNLNIQKKQLSFSGTQKSPKWAFKQKQVGNLLFGHAKKFSFDEENQILSGVRKYINILTSNKFNTLSEQELDGCILIIKESEKHRLKPPSKEKNVLATLTKQAESGDQEAIERLMEMISVNYIHQLTSDEIN